MAKPRTTKLARVKERLFRDIPTFDTSKGLYVPLPMLFRFVLGKFSPREWQVLSWIYLNCRKESLCSFTLDELGSGIDFKSKSRLRVLLRELERRHWITRQDERGTEYYVPRDPMDAIRKNVEDGFFPASLFEFINEFLEQMGREPVEVPAKKQEKR